MCSSMPQEADKNRWSTRLYNGPRRSTCMSNIANRIDTRAPRWSGMATTQRRGQ